MTGRAGALATGMSEATETTALKPVHYSALAGWANEDHAAALDVFRRGIGGLAGNPIQRPGLRLERPALTAGPPQAGRGPGKQSRRRPRGLLRIGISAVPGVRPS